MPEASAKHAFALFRAKIDNAAFVVHTDEPHFASDLGQSHLRAEAEQRGLIAFAQLEGGAPRDVNRSGRHVGAPIVSSRFVEVLQEQGLTGWLTYPITLTDRDGAELSGYCVLGVSGRCGPINDDLSELVTVPPPVPTGRESRQLKGLVFDSETWDGSDFCCPTDGTLNTFVSARATEALRRARLTGFDLEPAAENLRSFRADGSLLEQPWDKN